MALMLRVGDESTRVDGEKEEKRKWVDSSSPHGITPATINNKERVVAWNLIWQIRGWFSHVWWILVIKWASSRAFSWRFCPKQLLDPHWKQFGVRCPAKGHFDISNRSADPTTNSRPALPHELQPLPAKFKQLINCLTCSISNKIF